MAVSPLGGEVRLLLGFLTVQKCAKLCKLCKPSKKLRMPLTYIHTNVRHATTNIQLCTLRTCFGVFQDEIRLL